MQSIASVQPVSWPRELTFEEMYRHFHRSVRFLTERIIGDFHEAEDIAQETFLRIFLRWPSLRSSDALHVWVRRIARNTAIDRLRNASLHQVQPLIEDRRQAGFFPPDAESILPDLALALEKIPLPLGITLCLHAFDRCSLQEISRLTRTGPGNVKVRIHRARSLLRSILHINERQGRS